MLDNDSSDAGVVQRTKSRMIAILLATGDLDRARGMIDEYLKMYPDDPQGMIFEGAWHRIAGDIEKAEEAYEAAVRWLG